MFDVFKLKEISASKPVVWRYKNVSYLPKIKKTNKRMLTSSHDSDYLMREVG